MTEKKKTYRGVTFSLAMAGVVVCALICGCTTVDDTTADPGVPTAEITEITEDAAPQSGMPQNPGGNGTAMEPDFATAAATLGVTEDALRDALGDGDDGERMDLEAAAAELGVTVEQLQDALGTPPATPAAS